MSLASKFRWLPVPTYGQCGGANKVCAITREELDPLDQLFFDHDWACHDANGKLDERGLKEAADKVLDEAMSKLTDEDMNKIPVWIWKWPFFKRAYAKLYRKEALKVFS